MAVREVLEIGHPTLLKTAAPVDPGAITGKEIQEIIGDVVESMRAANGSGLAANQIGIDARIFSVEVSNNPRYPYKPAIALDVIINPVLTATSERTFENYEGCLSVPNLRGVVTRNLEISVEGYDQNGEPIERTIRGYSAGTYQHEADHLDGLLFPHRVKEPSTFCTWSVFKTFHEADFVSRVESLVTEFGA